jgi:glycosyltransferase involved in cell wall biosynthesis
MKNDSELPTFKIYYAPTGYGLVKDAKILHDAIQKLGFSCSILPVENKKTHNSRGYRYWLYLLKKYNALGICKKITQKFRSKSSVYSLHLENIIFSKCFLHENHILIPNQEWFDPHSIDLLFFMKAVWCKSHFARNIFNELDCKTDYIGFCSEIDTNLLALDKSRDYFFSRIGKSKYRGGKLLIDLWSQHPEWPMLKIVIHSENIPHPIPENVECFSALDTEGYRLLSASSLFHIYMTETEGFGHSIVEAMGYGSVIIVTDAPPMNEVLNDKCAILVKANYVGQKMLAPRFGALQADVAGAINKVLILTDDEVDHLAANAQATYQLLQRDFINRVGNTIDKLLKI